MPRNITLRMIVVCLGIMLAASAWGAPRAERAPVNPAFQMRTVEEPMSGFRSGVRPAPVDLSHLKSGLRTLTVTTFPSTYDLRTLGKLSPVKNQASSGSCWAFATYGSMESCLLTGSLWDFSENNLKNTHGFDLGANDGGNHFMSTAYLARWSGPVDESDDPYVDTSTTSPSFDPVMHVQDVIFLPDRGSYTDNDAIKSAVMTYGAVYTTYYTTNSSYNLSTNSYYYNGNSAANHAVCIVGWDDSYDKNNFNNPKPSSNGAFLVRNSWGSSWGDGGYFYISYRDTKVGKSNAVFTTPEPVTNFARTYQYDPLGWVTSYGYGTNTCWFANIFTSQGLERLDSVAFYAASANSSYNIYIYLDTGETPVAGSPVSTTTGTLEHPGYHTVDLSTPVVLQPGQWFSVVVRLTTPGYNYPAPTEIVYSGYTSAATASPGQSFISYDGLNWDDMTIYEATANMCLKAFTSVPTGDVSGTITLRDYSGNITLAPVDVEIRSTGKPTDVRHVYPQSDGSYTLTDLIWGEYDLSFKASHWLRETVSVTVSGDVSGVDIDMRNGDCNGDNVVNAGDLIKLRLAYGTTPGSSTWDPNADLNGDGVVNAGDLIILRKNYGSSGDP